MPNLPVWGPPPQEAEIAAIKSRVTQLEDEAERRSTWLSPVAYAAGIEESYRRGINDFRPALTAAEAESARLAAENQRLKKLLDRDHTGLASALSRVRELIGTAAEHDGWAWIARGEWGPYDYTQRTPETLQQEIGNCFNEIEQVAETALRESGVRADAAFRPDADKFTAMEADVARLVALLTAEEASNVRFAAERVDICDALGASNPLKADPVALAHKNRALLAEAREALRRIIWAHDETDGGDLTEAIDAARALLARLTPKESEK